MRTLLVLLAVFALAFAQVAPICANDNACNTYASKKLQRCEIPSDPALAVCEARKTFAYKTTTLDVKGMCTGSLNFGFGSSHVCGGYSTATCDVAAADIAYTRCVAGSTLSGKCVAPNATTTVDKHIRCNAAAATPVLCGNNMICHNFVCQPRLTMWDNCWSSPLTCGIGLVCDGDYCLPKNAKLPQEPCKVDDACVSGTCTAGRCDEKRSVACWNDGQCGEGVCYIETGKTIGVCTSSARWTTFKYEECLRRSCSDTRATTTCTLCEVEAVNAVCAVECEKREDLRLRGDGYVYDCTARTRVLQPANTCNYKTAINNCLPIPLSGALSHAISFFVVVIATLMIFA